MASLLEITFEVADNLDEYLIEKLYCVCRLCYRRISGTDGTRKRQPLSFIIVKRSKRLYEIDFSLEFLDLSKPNTLCASCKRRLARLDSGEITLLTQERWRKLCISIEFQTCIENAVRDTRQRV